MDSLAEGATVTISNSTFSGNQASDGGAIYNRYNLILSNSTVSGNSAAVYGGGIYNFGYLDR